MRKVAVIVGGGLGDEGKGKVTCHWLNRYNVERDVLCVRSSGGTNTGATIFVDDSKVLVHMLPVGVFMEGTKHGYIGNGVYVNPAILETELEMMVTISRRAKRRHGRVFISKYAHVVTGDQLEEDEKKESVQKLGSTKNGVSIAAGAKYRYQGTQVKDLPDHVLSRWKFRFGVKIVDPYDFFESIPDWNIVIEGTQGVGLDVNHGWDYPHVSAGSFSLFGLLDGVGYALAPDEVVMCLKAYNSYFGPVRMGDMDFDDNDFRVFANEYGTTTKRPRNLAWLDTGLVRRSAQLIQPTHLVVNHIDALNWFSENKKKWKLWIDGEMPMGFRDLAWVDDKLTQQSRLFLETLKEASGAKHVLVGTGPQSSDIIEYT